MCVVFAVAGMMANQVPDNFLLSALIVGLVWGTLRCLGFGNRPWQNSVIIMLIMLGHQLFFPINMEHALASWLLVMAFYAIALLGVFLVVWLKERDERRGR